MTVTKILLGSLSSRDLIYSRGGSKSMLIISLPKLSFRNLTGAAAYDECNLYIFISINSSVVGL